MKGVFWLIDDNLVSFPFDGQFVDGISKSRDTYNHRKLWEYVRPKGCAKDFDYYPRGRVELTNKGRAVIYMSPHIDEKYIGLIKKEFELEGDVAVKYDHSRHYQCVFDRELTDNE